jgi:hypothetical protein
MKRFRPGATATVVGLAAAVLFVGCENAVLAPGDFTGGTADPGDSGSTEPASDPAQKAEVLKAVGPTSNLKSFGNEKKLEAYLKEQFISSVQPWAYYDWRWNEMDVLDFGIDVAIPLVGDASVAAAAPAGGEAVGGEVAGADYSTTNIQELGVDESDVVKTDGTHFYVAAGAEVKIVRAAPADSMAVLATIPVNGPVDSLYLYGDMAVILYRITSYNYSYYGYYEFALVAPVYDYQPYDDAPPVEGIPEDRPYSKTGVLIVDVADPAAPSFVQDMLFEGDLETSRLTGGRLHLVQRFRPSVPSLRYWYNATEEDLADVEAENQALVDSLTLDDLIPACYELGETGAVAAMGRAVEAGDFARPDEPQGHNIITVVTVDLEDLSSGFRSCAAVADVDTVYASTRALYLAHTIYSYTRDPQPQPLAGYDYSQQTVIRKFDLTSDRVRNVASGRVWGRPLNQFSLGEREDILRIATTTGFVWSAGLSSRSHVFCLAESRGAHLDIIGTIEDIAPGERIYAARFLGERGFLVTFRQVDPLFTLDLSDPSDPKLIGELKVPGYSDYIHPLGEDHLLTIGKDPSRVCLSVFDVSDFADPRLLHKEVLSVGWSDSEALRNHKAFTFWAERDLLAVPVRYNERGEDGNWSYFAGLCVYRVTVADGIELLGRIDTASADSGYYYWYWPGWTRGVFVGDDVYAVTPDAVRAAAVADLGGPGDDAEWTLGLGVQ